MAHSTNQSRASASLALAQSACHHAPKVAEIGWHSLRLSWPEWRRPCTKYQACLGPHSLKAGMQDVRFHDLRRTVGAWLAGNGESLHLIGKVLNHTDVSTTAIYARLNLDPVRQALERNASKMLAAAEPQQIPAVMRKARKRLRSMQNPTSQKLEIARTESDSEILPVRASR